MLHVDMGPEDGGVDKLGVAMWAGEQRVIGAGSFSVPYTHVILEAVQVIKRPVALGTLGPLWYPFFTRLGEAVLEVHVKLQAPRVKQDLVTFWALGVYSVHVALPKLGMHPFPAYPADDLDRRLVLVLEEKA